CLLAAVAVALWLAIPKNQPPASSGQQAAKDGDRPAPDGARPPDRNGKEDVKPDQKPDQKPDNKPDAKPDNKPDRDTPPRDQDGGPRKDAGEQVPPKPDRPEPPSKERLQVGNYLQKVGKLPSLLVARRPDGWERLPFAGTLTTTETLVSLPGYT